MNYITLLLLVVSLVFSFNSSADLITTYDKWNFTSDIHSTKTDYRVQAYGDVNRDFGRHEQSLDMYGDIYTQLATSGGAYGFLGNNEQFLSTVPEKHEGTLGDVAYASSWALINNADEDKDQQAKGRSIVKYKSLFWLEDTNDLYGTGSAFSVSMDYLLRVAFSGYSHRNSAFAEIKLAEISPVNRYSLIMRDNIELYGVIGNQSLTRTKSFDFEMELGKAYELELYASTSTTAIDERCGAWVGKLCTGVKQSGYNEALADPLFRFTGNQSFDGLNINTQALATPFSRGQLNGATVKVSEPSGVAIIFTFLLLLCFNRKVN